MNERKLAGERESFPAQSAPSSSVRVRPFGCYKQLNKRATSTANIYAMNLRQHTSGNHATCKASLAKLFERCSRAESQRCRHQDIFVLLLMADYSQDATKAGRAGGNATLIYSRSEGETDRGSLRAAIV